MSEELLQALARRLNRYRIPSLHSLIAHLAEAEDLEKFLSLVKEFLPEREADILSQPTPAEQIAAFASYFEDRYFPLREELKLGDEDFEYADLIRFPVILMGISYEEYHEIPSTYRPGTQLMTFLVANPYEEEDRSALAEACLEHVPRELLERVPEAGFTPGELRPPQDTEYKGLSLWANVIWHSTGNPFLDFSWEDDGYIDWPDWTKEEVEEATRFWQEAETIYEEINRLAEWLEVDPPARFEELLKAIEERRD